MQQQKLDEDNHALNVCQKTNKKDEPLSSEN